MDTQERNFTEKELLSCVSFAFKHECFRGVLSTHSQLERWIVQELKKKEFPLAYSSLKAVMEDLFTVYDIMDQICSGESECEPVTDSQPEELPVQEPGTAQELDNGSVITININTRSR